jgi:serine/threonine-protein kinase
MRIDCDAKRLAEFLDGRLSDERKAELLEHLDSCMACCELLQSLAANAAEWRELPALLHGSERCPLPSSKDDVDDEAFNDDTDSKLSLDFLSPSDDPAMLGRVGRYEILGVIGQGGMGVVLKGFDRPLNRTIAIKLLAPELAANGVARRRFAREAQAAAAVVHQHVIAIQGVAEHRNLPYLVMPYLPGQSLQQRIDQNGPLAVAEILRIGMQAASGLAAAHDRRQRNHRRCSSGQLV